jgi:aspartyl-tRNA(Asn)/glutamyl-tRNA(Gln) amidotransferase subunit A
MHLFKNNITKLQEDLRNGDYQVSDYVQHMKTVIDEKDSDINAFIEVFDDAEYTQSDSLLAAIPVGVKDNILIKGKLATSSSHILDGYTASYDAFVIEELRKQGAVFAGRLNMDELAMGSSTETSYYGPTKNPCDLSRVPGGSSGGPAAAVAAHMVPYALGSDTGGSIRQPASFCGIVGLKPTYGAVSRRGLMAMASSLDVIGPLTHTVDDAEIVFNAISAYDELDSTCVPLEVRKKYQEKNVNNKRVGVLRSLLENEGVSKEVKDNFEASCEQLKEQGYEIVDIDIPHIEHSLAVYYILQPAEASSNFARYDGIRYGLSEDADTLIDTYVTTKTKGFGDEVKRRIMLGTHVLSSGYHDQYYYKAQDLRREISHNIHKIFDDVDVIATPTAPEVAFPLGGKTTSPLAMYLQDMFTVPYNLSGNPAISVPSGVNDQGLPFGMHFVAPRFCEKKLFAVSRDFSRGIL